MKLLLELSGENPTLPVAEAGCIGTVIDHRRQVAVVESPHPEAASRLAMTKVVMEYLGECEPAIPSFSRLLRELAIETRLPFAGRASMVHAGSEDKNPCSQCEFERLIGTMISGPVSLKNPLVEYRAVLSGDRCYLGRVLFRIDRGGFDARNPGKREFFHPGVMMPRMARTLINLSLAAPGEIVLDPFCGTGGILIEAGLLGMHAVGSDCDSLMISGSRKNVVNADLLLADVTALPFASQAIDAVATDFPYGQSVSIRKKDTMDSLYAGALDEIRRVLRGGRRAVVVTHRDIAGLAESSMTVLQQHEQRVHKSLTRRILVLAR